MAEESTVLMYVPGIKGSSTLVGTDPGKDGSHAEWIPINSCSFTLNRNATVSDGADEKEASSKPPTNVDPIEIERQADQTSADLLAWLALKDVNERRKDEVLIDYCARSGRYFLRYVLQNVEIVSCKIGFKAPDDLTETITLTYSHIAIRKRPIDENGVVQFKREQSVEYTVHTST
jgi:type VI protein secretion system component Hcp